ncbi:MAG: division/cell wall cluster transcriptional repressor MraZ [Gammaproteobacteria bacterium]|nr:division/cell wall cluster transcriptional repressor MraZ [Gammaproteobacteria bacterium]
MFRGSSAINLDAKGRLAMPSRYRNELIERCEGQMVITIDLVDPCLCIYPLPDWEKVEEQLSQMPSLRAQTRQLNRLLIGSAVDLELDNSGRLLIPVRLREQAQLTRQVMLVGQLNKFQLWDENKWNELLSADLEDIKHPDHLPEELMNLVL